jgi:hypothetical protein
VIKKIVIILLINIFIIPCATFGENIKTFVVKVPKLILRSEPTRNSNSITILTENETVLLVKETNKKDIIDSNNGEWFEIQTRDNKKGYVFNFYLTEIKKEELNYLITKDSVGPIHIRMKFEELYKLSNYKVTKEPYVVNVKINNNTILELNDKHGGMNYINSIIILSDKFSTKEGLKVGMSIHDLKKIYPKMNVFRPDSTELDASEYILPHNYQTMENNHPKYVFLVSLKSNNGKLLGVNYRMNPEPNGDRIFTDKIDDNGYVDKIFIYDWR